MRRRVATLLVIVAPAVAACGDAEQRPSRDAFDAARALRDLEAQVELGPRPAGSRASRRTAELIAARLRAAGARGVGIQRPHLNVVGHLPGREPGAVVLGAHHDTKDTPPILGANDGASGVAVVLELARSLPRRPRGPAIHFALFDAEEARGDRPFERDGLRGSRQYVDYAKAGGGQGSPPLGRIEAMVLFDLVGDCELGIPREASSDPALYERFASASRRVDGDPAPFQGTAQGVLDDHVPFLRAGVPSVDLIDFTYGPGRSPGGWWHTREDTLEHVCPESLDAVGEAAVRAIPPIGR